MESHVLLIRLKNFTSFDCARFGFVCESEFFCRGLNCHSLKITDTVDWPNPSRALLLVPLESDVKSNIVVGKRNTSSAI